MTVGEQRFMELVPNELRSIARELKEIKEELKKLNSLEEEKEKTV